MRTVRHYTRKPYFALGANTFIDKEIGRVLEAKGPNVYEEITHIPFIISGKDVLEKGTTYEHPISHIDVVPTVLEYFGMKPCSLLQGKSLMPVLKDREVKVNEAIFIEFGRYEVAHDHFGGFQPLRCIYDGRYKLAINLLTSDELYDLKEDREELHNLIEDAQYEKIRNMLHDQLLKWMDGTNDPFRGSCWERRPWRKDERR